MDPPMDAAQLAAQRRPHNQPPSSLACIACREKHLKCNAKMPVCGRCQDSGSVCIYKQSRRGFKRRRKSPDGYEDYDESSGKGGSPTTRLTTNPITTSSIASLEDSCSLAIADLNFDVNQKAFGMENLLDGATSTHYSMAPDNTYPHPTQTEAITSIGKSFSTKNGADKGLTQSYEIGSADLSAGKASAAYRAGAEGGTDTLIDIYYKKFNSGHPFIIPRRLYRWKPALLPPQLKPVMQFAASHFMPSLSPQNFRTSAENITSSGTPNDGYKVQGLMLFGITLYARCEQEYAMVVINQAIDLALDLGMNFHSFALKYGMGNSIVEESWRRTWWELYTIDGLLALLSDAQHPFRLQDIQTDMPLPCEEIDYVQCTPLAPPRGRHDFLERAFAAEAYDYSSMAYKIEAVRLAGNVLGLGKDIFASHDEQVDRVDISLSDFALSLPPNKRHIIERDGKVDEVLFSAHGIVNCALIMLHRPRSNLIYVRNHYPTPCTRQEEIGTPVSTYEVHTSKAIRAANAISNATAVQTPLATHSPCFICAIVLAAVVHLPAYTMEASRDRSSATKERLQLTISALNSVGETWPMAKAVKKQISQFARDISFSYAAATGSSTAEAQIQDIDIESMMDDQTWLDELSYFEPNANTMMLDSASTEPISMVTLVPAVNTF